jgi:nucleoid-associated protein YgaU
MTRKIDKVSNGRLTFGIVASILFIAILIIWLISGISGITAEKPPAEKTAVSVQPDELKKLKDQNTDLRRENDDLKKQLAAFKTEKEKRKKEYVVREGETLFGIARRTYGNGFKYIDLANDNDIQDPATILAGQKLIIYY